MPRGALEQTILFALVRLGGEAHGPALVLEIEDRTGRRISPGAMYTVLDRLAEKGHVEGWIGDSAPERGGRRRKVYRILPEGARALLDWYEGIRELAAGTADLLRALAQPGRP
jgi:DNA-binding PadR family transcriptional regulator